MASQAMHGGAELYMTWIMGDLGREWVRGVVALADGPLVTRLAEDGYDVEVVRTGASKPALLSSAWKLRRVIRRQRPAVIHADGVKAALVAVLACAGTRVPVVWHKVDYARDGWLGNAVARRCRLVVGMSASVTDSLPDRLRERVRVVHSGIPEIRVDRVASRREILAELSCEPDAAVLAHFGRLHPRKGQLDLVAAIPAVLERHPNARFLFHPSPAEDGVEEAFQREIVRRAADLDVEHVIAITPGRWRPVNAMAGCDVVVVPSKRDPVSGWREGFGLVGVEALAAGTPVVAYADGALPEVLGDCAEFAPTGDPAKLARALTRVLDDRPLRDRMVACGLRRAQRYTLRNASGRMAECYREAASAGRTAS